MQVRLYTSLESYSTESDNTIFDNSGTKELQGEDFGDLETGVASDTKYFYVRHDGTEKVYNVAYYLRSLGNEWGGYCADYPDKDYNPNWFKNGGLNDDGLPNTSTQDYEFMRLQAYNNPEMGLRVHYDRESPAIRTDGLGYDNVGLSFSAITLQNTSLDTSKGGEAINGEIAPAPIDASQQGYVGDEALLGLSVKLSEDIIGSGHVQFTFAIKYRYTI